MVGNIEMDLGQRVSVERSERAWSMGFRSKQETRTKVAAFYLSLFDAYRADPDSVRDLADVAPEWISSLLTLETWVRFYWSQSIVGYLDALPERNVNELGVARVVNNIPCAGKRSATVGVEQSGERCFALYSTTLSAELLPLDCGHYVNGEELMLSRERCKETIGTATVQCAYCPGRTQVASLLGYWNRTAMPNFDAMVVQQDIPCEEIRQSSWVKLPCGCVLSDVDAVNQSEQMLGNGRCVQHGAPIPPMELYLIKTLRSTSGKAEIQIPKWCLNPGHELRAAEKPLHGYCYLCTPCIQLLHSSCQQGQPTQCMVCCKSMSISDFPEYSAPVSASAPCANQCGRDGEAEFLLCKHKLCRKCASQMYRTQATACPCGTPLDANDFSLLWAYEGTTKSLTVPTYQRNKQVQRLSSLNLPF